MQNREFENKVQGKMDELKLTPADAVWDKVEASLPKEKKRRWVIFVLLFAVLITGGLFVWNNFNKNEAGNTAQERTPKNETNAINIVPEKTIQNKKQNDTITNLATTKENTVTESSLNKNKKHMLSAATRIKIKKPAPGSWSDSKEEHIVNADPKKMTTKGDTKINIKKPSAIRGNEEETAKADDVTVIAEENIAPVVVMRDSLNSIPATVLIDSVVTGRKDTLVTAKKENKKKKKSAQWHYGIELAGGSSNVKSNLFSNGPVYADYLSSAVSFPGGGNPASTQPGKPTGSIGLTAGFYAEKSIAKKWTFKTALNYLYQSNNIKVGKKVDSVINFSLDINKSLTAGSYYRAGSSTNYKNKFHFLEIPLIFRYQFSSSSRFYAEAGPSITYLLRSNALVYSTRSQAYVTDKDIFNKLGISINGGAAINLAKRSALPFSIGYRFKYSLGSVVKRSLGQQHFINSFFYLKIPFKK